MNMFDTLDYNKKIAKSIINKLSTQLGRENQRWIFKNKNLISEIEQDISRFKNLIIASDRMNILFNNANFAVEEINKFGNFVANNINSNRSLSYSYGVDEKFRILYKLLNQKIQRREEFMNCILSYNTIVLDFLELKQQDFYSKLELETISILPPKQDYLIETNVAKSLRIGNESSRQIVSSGEIVLTNDANIMVGYAFFYNKNGKNEYEKIGDLEFGETVYFSGSRDYFQLLLTDKSSISSKYSSSITTARKGFAFKIIANRRTNTLQIIPNDK